MEEVVTRIVERRFPELTGAYHLPRFARVLAVADPPNAAALCDDFRPRFAVDLQVLSSDGEPDPTLPALMCVPLPVPGGGTEMGFYAFPEEGTVVVVSFAYGLPSKPFILQILPHGLSLPRVPKDDQLWQHSDAVQQRADAEGNWLRQTDARITDSASERVVQAIDNAERYQTNTVEVEEHSTESIGGIKTIEALGALKLLSGGSATLIASGDLQERIQGMRESVAAVSQSLQAPTTWLGSEDLNVLNVLCDLIDLVAQMSTAIAQHKHGPSPPPGNANIFTEHGKTATVLLTELETITE